MKKLFTLFLFFAVSASGQNSFLYGLYIGYDPGTQSGYCGIAEYNESAGDWTIDNAWSDSDIHAFGDHTLDPVNLRWYQVYGDSLNMYLLMVDLVTGDTLKHLFKVDSVGPGTPGSVTIGGNINGTFYNCDDNCVYFTHYNAPYEDSMHLAKVNVNDFTVTELKKFYIGDYAIDNQVSPTDQNMYLLYYDYWAGTSKVFTYAIQSNTLTVADVSLANFNVGELLLTYNPGNGKLYGIDYDLSSFQYPDYLATLTGVSLDPVTGQLDFLTPGYSGNVIGSNMTLHSSSAGDNVYFIAQNSNPSYYEVLGAFNLQSNTISFDTVSYTNAPYSNPVPFGIDGFNFAKGCSIPSVLSETTNKEDCSITLVPDADGKHLSIQSGCDLTMYHNLRLQVVDLLGRKVFDRPLADYESVVPLNLQPDEVYIYGLFDGAQRISAGKLVPIQ